MNIYEDHQHWANIGRAWSNVIRCDLKINQLLKNYFDNNVKRKGTRNTESTL